MKRARAAGGKKIECVDVFAVFHGDGWTCQLCGWATPAKLRGTKSPQAPEADHIIALCNGGSNTYDNVRLLCRDCNGKKSREHDWVGENGILTQQNVRHIRKLWSLGTMTQVMLGKMFGVKPGTISEIVWQRSWRRLPAAPVVQ